MTNIHTTYRSTIFLFRLRFYADCAKTVAYDL